VNQTALYSEAIAHARELLARAQAAAEPEPGAMTLATADLSGRVSARIVLLKGLDERGFVFYTNYESAKAAQIAQRKNAALCILWKNLRDPIQIRVEGALEKTSAAEADAYFASRPRDSQIGAWASLQSQTLPERALLEARVAEFEHKFAGSAVPRPPHWGGYRLLPDVIEFWYGQSARLHERLRYELAGGSWSKRFLYP
jgi:pyridoxamine 5'-phosphate oxidase